MGSGRSEIHHPDGRCELVDDGLIRQSPFYNHDLAPVGVADRRWTTYNYAALWISMAHCIPTYMLASSLMAGGMSWKQALFTILLGNLIVLAPILLNSHPGTKYGIPFPVFARASYGIVGSNVPAIMRALVACGWFGIQTWLGGEALYTLLVSLIRLASSNPQWADPSMILSGHSLLTWGCFLVFWGINIWIIYAGMDVLRVVENWAAPFVLVMTALLCVWVYNRVGGVGPIMEQQGKLNTWPEFWPIFLPSLTGMIGYWATLSLNMPDFTRFGHSQRDQAIGQVVALPTTMVLFAAMGVFITSGAQTIFAGKLPPEELKQLWDPMKLALHFDSFATVVVAMFTVVIATLAVNIAANVVSPANDFANAFPRFIGFRTGGLLTGVLGILIQPWKLLADPSGYVFTWLGGYSGGLAAIAGVLIVDYWVIRRRRLYLADLYLSQGVYGYDRGWHWAAIHATVWGCLVSWAGYLASMCQTNSGAVLGIAAVLVLLDAVLMLYAHTYPTGLVAGVALVWALTPAHLATFQVLSQAAWEVGLLTSAVIYLVMARRVLGAPEGFEAVAPAQAPAPAPAPAPTAG